MNAVVCRWWLRAIASDLAILAVQRVNAPLVKPALSVGLLEGSIDKQGRDCRTPFALLRLASLIDPVTAAVAAPLTSISWADVGDYLVDGAQVSSRDRDNLLGEQDASR